MESVLVTGANGFIGSHLSVELFSRCYEVYALKRSMVSKNKKYV